MATIFELDDTVSKIIQVERAQLDQRIQKNKARQNQQNDLGSIKANIKNYIKTLDMLQKDSTFSTKKASTTDSSVVNATSEVGAAEILFDVTVNSLAIAARATSTATLFGADHEGSNTTLTSAEINSTASEDLDPNANVISGSPNFGAGGNMSTGNFEINGQTIVVDSDDTVNTILSKINSSPANINAYYDSATDKIIMEQESIGSSYNIELGEDNTGFFEKLNLTEDLRDSLVTGEDADQYQNLKDTDLSTVSAGYFTINNITFTVDPDNDSLNDVISRINASKAGVSIFYDENSNEVTMTSKVEGQDIELRNDTSGFLDAINVLAGSEQTYTGTDADVTINGTNFTPDGNELTIHGTKLNFISTGSASVNVKPDHDKMVDAVKSMKDSYNNAISSINSYLGKKYSGSQTMFRLATNMRTRLMSAIDNPGSFSYLSEVGITFTRGVENGKMELDESKMRNYLDSDASSVASLFSYDSDNDGLRDDLGITNSMESFLKEYSQGTTGYFDARSTGIQDVIDNNQKRITREEEYFENRYDVLLEQMIIQQQALQQLQSQVQKANAIRVDFNLINGSNIS